MTNPSRLNKIQITGNSNSDTATKVNVQEANGEVNTQSIGTAFNKSFGLNAGDVVGASTLLNQYTSTPSDWTAQSYPSGQVIFYGGKQWMSKETVAAGDVPSVSLKWEEVTFEALANKTVTVDQTIIDGSTNAVSGNAVFDGLNLKANLSSPALTGTPTAPTATAGTNTAQVATTAFVTNGLNGKIDKVTNTKTTTPIVGGNVNARMCVSNAMLYLPEYVNGKVSVFSLENPMSPKKIYEFTVASNPRHVEVRGRNLFVACTAANKVEIYDIQNPQSALKLGEIPTGSQPKMFELIGSDLFVVCAGSSKVEKYKIYMPDALLSNFYYQKIGDVTVGAGPLGISYNNNGLLAVCGNGDNVITILSADTLDKYQAPFGGAGHATCAWVGKTQLLVTDWTTESLLSIDYSNLLTPVLSSSIAVSENPEQIEIVGNKAYIPSLRIGVGPSYLDFIDLSNAKSPVKIKSEELVVNGAGFTAPYTDGVNTYIYVNGHFAPFNIDAIKIDNGDFHRNESLMTDDLYVNRLGVANLTTNTVDESKGYINAVSPKAITQLDNVIRMESGTVTLPNPNSVRDGKIVTVNNTSNVGNVTVSNPFAGAPSIILYPYESISLQATKNGAVYKWDAVGGRKNISNIFDNGESIGIGTGSPNFSSPTRRVLDINGVSESMLALSVGGVAGAYLNVSTPALEISAQGSKSIYLSAGGAVRQVLTSSGNTLFGKTTDAGDGIIQANGNITALPAITPNQVPTKAQLDLKADLASPNLTGVPTAPTATAGTNTTQIATTAFVLANGARPYRVYTALLTQSDTNAPVATVLENTLGGTVTWSYVSTGRYNGTLSGASFTPDKTACFINNGQPSAAASAFLTASTSVIRILTASFLSSPAPASDGQLNGASIEIRVYY